MSYYPKAQQFPGIGLCLAGRKAETKSLLGNVTLGLFQILLRHIAATGAKPKLYILSMLKWMQASAETLHAALCSNAFFRGSALCDGFPTPLGLQHDPFQPDLWAEVHRPLLTEQAATADSCHAMAAACLGEEVAGCVVSQRSKTSKQLSDGFWR